MFCFIFSMVVAFCAVILPTAILSSACTARSLPLSPIEVDAFSAAAPSTSNSSPTALATPEPSFPALRSCFRTSSLPSKKSVRFLTQDAFNNQEDADLVDFHSFDVDVDTPLRPCSVSSNSPHIPGAKYLLQFSPGSIKMIKHLGTYDIPSQASLHRPRCKNIINYRECFDCRRPALERYNWQYTVFPAPLFALSAHLPVYPLPTPGLTERAVTREKLTYFT
ncbi:uncharacterized protein RSE6_08425 [Rhynchosporium secalis]|uniref:Uncharacterized protein n=1 Tax=Rhynchosporium secalis TaxID=38038 RepID=A0A1E1MFD7_RHYSE|nr:uncharacterized protein RSE6_08425 [Rhynchosporium secalis]